MGGILYHLWLQRHPKWDPYNEITPFSSSGDIPKSIIFGCVFEGRVWKASGHQFVLVLVDLGVPWGRHFAPKQDPETESKNLAKKSVLGKRGRESEPLKRRERQR